MTVIVREGNLVVTDRLIIPFSIQDPASYINGKKHITKMKGKPYYYTSVANNVEQCSEALEATLSRIADYAVNQSEIGFDLKKVLSKEEMVDRPAHWMVFTETSTVVLYDSGPVAVTPLSVRAISSGQITVNTFCNIMYADLPLIEFHNKLVYLTKYGCNFGEAGDVTELNFKGDDNV